MSTATITERPVVAGTSDGGVPARRAVIRWAWRLFRREWRQQLLVLTLLMIAVAAEQPPGPADHGTPGGDAPV